MLIHFIVQFQKIWVWGSYQVHGSGYSFQKFLNFAWKLKLYQWQQILSDLWICFLWVWFSLKGQAPFIFKKMSTESQVWINTVCLWVDPSRSKWHTVEKAASWTLKSNNCRCSFPQDTHGISLCRNVVCTFPVHLMEYFKYTQGSSFNKTNNFCFIKDILKWNWLFLTVHVWPWRMWLLAVLCHRLIYAEVPALLPTIAFSPSV